ncbi:MAG: response regulator [Chloroflexota bacterium]|nr:MAG: response regulator [Chloroflexota bacterium]
MLDQRKSFVVLIAEDDPDDRLLVGEALNISGEKCEHYFVEDGRELIDYLCGLGKYQDSALSPRPDLILLDLNMPRLNGRQALKQIKALPNLARIPVVVLTTSSSPEDIQLCYTLGACGYIIKPVSFDDLAQKVRQVVHYWTKTVVHVPE